MHIFWWLEANKKILCEKINTTIADRKFLLYLHSNLRRKSAHLFSNLTHK